MTDKFLNTLLNNKQLQAISPSENISDFIGSTIVLSF